MGSDDRVKGRLIGQNIHFALEGIVYELGSIGNGMGRVRFNARCARQGIDPVEMHIQLHGLLL